MKWPFGETGIRLGWAPPKPDLGTFHRAWNRAVGGLKNVNFDVYLLRASLCEFLKCREVLGKGVVFVY